MKGTIYKITSPTNKIYIGSTNNFNRRIKEYKSLKHKQQTRLYNSFLKHGYNKHIFEIIEECEIENLYIRERYWQEHFNVLNKYCGLNCQYVNTSDKPKYLSEETKLKISKATKGKNNPRYNKEVSIITKNKISKANKGRKQSLELNKKQSQRMINNNYSKLSKEIIDEESGIIYKSIRQAALNLNINYSTLKLYLNNKLKNKTTLKYL